MSRKLVFHRKLFRPCDTLWALATPALLSAVGTYRVTLNEWRSLGRRYLLDVLSSIHFLLPICSLPGSKNNCNKCILYIVNCSSTDVLRLRGEQSSQSDQRRRLLTIHARPYRLHQKRICAHHSTDANATLWPNFVNIAKNNL